MPHATFAEKISAVKRGKTLKGVPGKEKDIRARKIVGAMVAKMKRAGKE